MQADPNFESIYDFIDRMRAMGVSPSKSVFVHLVDCLLAEVPKVTTTPHSTDSKSQQDADEQMKRMARAMVEALLVRPPQYGLVSVFVNMVSMNSHCGLNYFIMIFKSSMNHAMFSLFIRIPFSFQVNCSRVYTTTVSSSLSILCALSCLCPLHSHPHLQQLPLLHRHHQSHPQQSKLGPNKQHQALCRSSSLTQCLGFVVISNFLKPSVLIESWWSFVSLQLRASLRNRRRQRQPQTNQF